MSGCLGHKLLHRSFRPTLESLQRARCQPQGTAALSINHATAQGHSNNVFRTVTSILSFDSEDAMPTIDVVGEEKVYGRYLTVYDRRVRITPTWDAEVTLVREYCQGPNSMGYCLPTGGFDPAKHNSIAECAMAELSEEALLRGGELVRLLPPEHPGLAEVKWCMNKFVPFLVLNPEADPCPGSRDVEEHIQVLRVGIPELRHLMRSGDMMLPTLTTCYMALELLQERGML